jgi:hypothetical protein
MKKRLLVTMLVLVLMGNALACNLFGGSTKGSGQIIRGEIEVSGFSGVTLETDGNLFIEIGNTEELRIEVDDNLLPRYEVKVDSKMLTIGLKDDVQLQPTEEVNFYLTAEELDTIVLSGSGKIEVQSANLRVDQFSVDLSGSGDLTMAGLTADALDVDVSGLGNVEIASGYVEEQAVVLSGDGGYDAEGLQSGSASIEISGSGSATVWAVSDLSVKGSGTGQVEYTGKPQLTTEGSVSVKPVSD